MTLKERLLAVFEGAEPDVVPWIADLTYWYAAHESGGDLPEKYRGAGVVKLYQDLGCGAHEHCLSLPCAVHYSGVETEVSTDKNPEGLPIRQTTAWHTSLGTLRQVQEWEPASACWAFRRYPVASTAELKILRYILEHQEAVPDDRPQREQMALWGDTGVTGTILLRSQLAGLLVTWMGVENTVYALADAPEEVEATLVTMADAESPLFEAATQASAPLVCFADNITGEVVSPRLFERYYVPFYRRRIPSLQKAGKKTFVHIDGTFRGLLPLVAGTGLDSAQSLTPAPVGDVPLSEWRVLAGPDLILWGGLPGAYFSTIYPESVLREMTMACLRFSREDRRFVLGVSDQVPPDADLGRVAMVSELVERFGRY